MQNVYALCCHFPTAYSKFVDRDARVRKGQVNCNFLKNEACNLGEETKERTVATHITSRI